VSLSNAVCSESAFTVNRSVLVDPLDLAPGSPGSCTVTSYAEELTGTNNVDVDPSPWLRTSSRGEDRLAVGSPAIDLCPSSSVNRDADSAQRVGRPDAGAFEYWPGQ
jgi:hypothetical protein